ncbi:polyamine aminopropyltransferase [Litorilituus lipolyticus]|uniref:Polyamine aminopropyltransferase n=1 Tax=Litorilituus lipolyticus TaxID=2491017 RepID=A0A502L7X8_9GAMM|nr:polyamine aminopropyltransferase [Litorilituus lipolyticus]TPH18575.1 polyamine aminopropyltransferase [Litorilituus lipolyticus]
MTSKKSFYLDDTLLILTMAVLAGCGLVYEYLLSHYAGRVLGVMESTIYTMIGLMIVSMGLGAFAARKVKCAFNGFVWLELMIACLGSISILLIGGLIAITQIFPHLIADMFAMPPDMLPKGGIFKQLNWLAMKTPYLFGVLLGFFIGMEIPLIARIREDIHQKHLVNNLGTIYGADYVGAGIGAAIWVLFLLSIDISKAAALTASLNLVAGTFFIMRYWQRLSWKKTFVSLHIALALIIIIMFNYGNQWLNQMNSLLYLDKVVHTQKTRYQQLTFTHRYMGLENSSIINFYLNGRLQFSSIDEHIYHDYLVAPALAGSARQEHILIIGGGDGLALRDILTYDPKSVTLVDLDSELIDIFQNPHQHVENALAENIIKLNKASLQDKRLTIKRADAFIEINELIKKGQVFDSIIVDLPDPSHPDLNKLYSVNFYARLNQLLSGDGLISIQSTSPYHAKDTFISIGKTVKAAGFAHVEQYHDNVPSFGEWGWTIAAKNGASPLVRLQKLTQLNEEHKWLNLETLKAAFIFPRGFYKNIDEIKENTLGSHTIYQLHQNAWKDQQGLNE